MTAEAAHTFCVSVGHYGAPLHLYVAGLVLLERLTESPAPFCTD